MEYEKQSLSDPEDEQNESGQRSEENIIEHYSKEFFDIESLIEKTPAGEQSKPQSPKPDDQSPHLVQPISLTLVCWSLGKLQVKDTVLMDKIVHLINQNLTKFDVKMLAPILYQISRIRYTKQQMIQPIIRHLESVGQDVYEA